MSDTESPGNSQTLVDDPGAQPGDTVTGQDEGEAGTDSRFGGALREIVSGSAVISILAVVLAMVAGAILIALTDQTVHAASGFFFSRPADTFSAIWQAVSGAYGSLFQGSVYNFSRPDFVDGIRPLTETLSFATPLVAAGLSRRGGNPGRAFAAVRSVALAQLP